MSSFSQVSRNFNKSTKPKYEIGLGAIRLDVPNYPGSANSTPRVIPFPLFIYRGDFIRADEEGTRARFFENEYVELGFSGGFNFPINSDQNKARKGMPDTDALFGFGPGIIHRMLKNDPLQRMNFGLNLRVNVSTDFKDSLNYQGLIIEPYLRYWKKLSPDSRFTIFSGLSVSFSDQKYADFFYTVDQQYVTSTRSRYDASSGLIDLAASLGVSVDLSDQAGLFMGAFYSNLTLAANKESSLVEEQHNLGTIIGLTWLFFESTEMVK